MKTNKIAFYLFVLITVLTGIKVRSQSPVSNPVPNIKTGDLKIRLDDWADLPHSSSRKPWARINMLRELTDGSKRMAVNDLNGPLYLIDGEDPSKVYKYMDFSETFSSFYSTRGKGTGFGGFAFHPDFKSNGTFYTTHAEFKGSGEADYSPLGTSSIALQWVLTEWKASNPAANKFSGSKTELVRWDIPGTIHGVQEIAFNPYAEGADPDYGILYVCVGEGQCMAKGIGDQNLNTVSGYMGTIWRIDPAGNNSPNGRYGIPNDNPFVGQEDAVEEVWAYGFRNPHRLDFDKNDGKVRLYCGDIGEHNVEEVNLIEKGGNYGWPHREGSYLFGGSSVYELPEVDEKPYLYPVAQFDHDDGAAMALGHVWRSSSQPELEGVMFLGDILSGRVFYAEVDSLKQGTQYALKEAQTFYADNRALGVEEITELDGSSARTDLKYGFDGEGAVYVVTKADGRVRKIRYLSNLDGSNFTSYKLENQIGNAEIIYHSNTIRVQVEPDTELSALVASFSLSEGASASVENISQTSGASINDFSDFTLTYNVKSKHGTVENWVVEVSEALRTAKEVRSFRLGGQVSDPIIDTDNKVIEVTVSADADLSALIASFELSVGAVLKVDGEPQVSGQSVQDYSSGSVAIIIEAEDGSSESWTIAVARGEVLASTTRPSKLTIFPSITEDFLTIKAIQEKSYVRVMDLNGKILLSKPTEAYQTQLDVSAIPSGLYLLQVQVNENWDTGKFIKQ